MLDSLASFFSGNQAAFIGGLHSLRQDATGCRTYLNWLVANKRINALDLSHTFTVARIGGWRKRIVVESVTGLSCNNPESLAGALLIAFKMAAVNSFCQPMSAMAVTSKKNSSEDMEAQTKSSYSTPCEYVRELIRGDQKRRAKEKLDTLLLEGLNSGDSISVDARFWRDLKQEALAKLVARKTSSSRK